MCDALGGEWGTWYGTADHINSVLVIVILKLKSGEILRRREQATIVIVPISTLRISWFSHHHHTKIADVIISNLIINLLRVPCSKFLKVGIIARLTVVSTSSYA